MKRRREPRVFFPWEKRSFGALGRARVRLVLLAAAGLFFVYVVHGREERAAAIRATRATLTTAGRAVAAYRADHTRAKWDGTKADGRGERVAGCPRGMGDLVAAGYERDEPVDAWGRSLRLVCPGRKDPTGFDLSSDGPDGLPGGLDRIE